MRKDFKLGKNSISILKGINLNIEQGEMVALLGPSGSGKSTFLNVLGGLVPPTSGEVLIIRKLFITIIGLSVVYGVSYRKTAMLVIGLEIVSAGITFAIS